MMMKNVVLIIIIAFIIICAFLYLYKAKKNGQKCIGCPYAKECKNGRCNIN